MSKSPFENQSKVEEYIRDCNRAFGLDPSKQYSVCRGVEPLRDLIDWLVYGSTRLARDRAVVYCP